MSKKVKLDEMGDELVKILMSYDKEVTEETKVAVDEVASGVMREIKNHITWNDKVYSKSFELKTIYNDERGKYIIWHVKSPHYKLTHLLELGHYTRNGQTKSRKFPHVQFGSEYAKQNLERIIKERIEKI